MSNIVAGIGRGQLLHLDEHIAAKKRNYEYYKAAFSATPVTLNPYLPGTSPNFWLSCMTINENVDITPPEIIAVLEKINAEARPIWKPMHMQPAFKRYEFVRIENKPVSVDIFKRGLCLPSDIKMTKEDLEKICSVIKNHLLRV